MLQLAQRYGMSDVGLAKICKKNNIPRPPKGYWSRKYAGQDVSAEPLPDVENDKIIQINTDIKQIEFIRHRQELIKESSLPGTLIASINVPDSLTNPHPLVSQTSELLKSCKEDKHGILELPTETCLSIHVSREALPRALRIMDALIKSLMSLGFEVFIENNATLVKLLGVTLGISIQEELNRRYLQAKDHILETHYYHFGYKLYEELSKPTGRLILAIDEKELYLEMNARRSWRDSETNKLEDLLPRFISGLIKAAAAKKAQLLKEPINREP